MALVLLAGLALAVRGQNTSSPAPASASYREEAMADSPRAYWRLGESRGVTAATVTGMDAGRYVNGVVLRRPGALRGDSDTAIALDGVNDTVRVPSSPRLSPTKALSLETWVNPRALPRATATILRKDRHYLLRLTSKGGLVVRLWKKGADKELSTGPNLVASGRWSHVVATWDGATMSIYVNATRRASTALASPVDRSASSLYLGSSGGSYDWLSGRIDEIAVYGSALSSSRVQAHYAAAGLSRSGPAVTLDAPAANSTMDAMANFGGSAGTAFGDSGSVTVKISRATAGGSAVQRLVADVRPAGTFSVKASSALPSGTYTARAEQANRAGTVGRSTARTFKVDAGAAPVVLSAGDIAGCDTVGDEATAALLDRLPGIVATVGDHVYEHATASDFANCYDPTWGRHKARTKPVVGDHEYFQPGADAYFDYFGAPAGDRKQGYYSYDVGTWHVVVMNTNCSKLPGGCVAGSAQEQWLHSDLMSNPARCTLAYLHVPRFSSGKLHGSDPAMTDLWRTLYAAGVELVVSGNDHLYERFAPQTPKGTADSAKGIRQFVVGTGGRSHYSFGTIRPHSEVRNNDTFGILKLSLRAGAYDWRFVPEARKRFSDSGSSACH